MRPGRGAGVVGAGGAPPRDDAFVHDVLAAFEADGRDLPWRRTRDPWAVLLAEVMLQQTQVERAVPRWHELLRRWPTPAAMAAAPAADVVAAWQGLGYNRRALWLHAAATRIVEVHGGAVPRELDALLALPGVGPYTARAVRVFAFELDDAVLDTNVGRVLARAVAGRPLAPAEAQRLADALVPTGRAWAWNQGLLDLGAQHCTARSPRCDACPARRRCAWALAGHPAPDPAAGSAATSRPQARFEGSDRQGRGRLLRACLDGPVAVADAATVAGWPDDAARAERVVAAMVADGLLARRDDRLVVTGRAP